MGERKLAEMNVIDCRWRGLLLWGEDGVMSVMMVCVSKARLEGERPAAVAAAVAREEARTDNDDAAIYAIGVVYEGVCDAHKHAE